MIHMYHRQSIKIQAESTCYWQPIDQTHDFDKMVGIARSRALASHARMGMVGYMGEIANKKRKERKQPLAELGPKHEQVLSLLVHGIEHRDSRINGGDHPVGQPLSVAQVADLLKVRRAYVRDLMSDALFKTKYNAALSDARVALAPAAIAKIGELIEWKGEGKAADANVALNASKTALGEDAKGFSVNVQVNNQTNIANAIRPGYVLDLGAMHGRRHDEDAPIIEGKAE